MKAKLYVQILNDPLKGVEVYKQIKNDYPTAKVSENIDQIIAQIQQSAERKKVTDGLAAGTAFPDFDEMDIEGKPLSLAKYKGKVVLVDFLGPPGADRAWQNCPRFRPRTPNTTTKVSKSWASASTKKKAVSNSSSNNGK